MAGVEAGDRRNRVTIEQKTRGASDGAGGNVSETWSALATVWAQVDMKGGREIIAADQTVHRLTAVITMRRRTDVTTAMRIIYRYKPRLESETDKDWCARTGARIFAILGIREISDGGWRWTELQCEEGAPS